MSGLAKTQIYLHWITLFFIVITFATMELRGWFPKGTAMYLLMKETHYNAGIFVLILMFLRLALKIFVPSRMPSPTRKMKAASLIHIVLYITFIAIPLLGVALMAYGGKTWNFIGFSVTPFVTPNSEIKVVTKNIHETWANISYFLIALHAVLRRW